MRPTLPSDSGFDTARALDRVAMGVTINKGSKGQPRTLLLS
jgi:hypothetical protein